MERLRIIFLALAVAILFIPFGIVIKKFSSIDTKSRFGVTFNPMTCYACPGCPCEYNINETEKFLLNSHDKSTCQLDFNEIRKGVDEELEEMTVNLSIKQFRDFYDCVKWYSQHPSSFGRGSGGKINK